MKKENVVLERELLNIAAYAVWLRVETQKNGIAEGWIFHPDMQKPIWFQGLDQALISMDRLFDGFAKPRRACEYRSFHRKKSLSELDTKLPNQICGALPKVLFRHDRSVLATFCISVRYRQNASWQGRMVWLEAQEQLRFRSFLELLTAMREALDHSALAENEARSRQRSALA